MAGTMTLSQFKVDLQALDSAAGAVQQQADAIGGQCAQIQSLLRVPLSPAVWSTPASGSFDQLQQACVTAMNELNALLADMVGRMRAAYQSYYNAELDNFKNFDTSAKKG